MFKLVSDYKPSGDKPQAIKQLVSNIQKGKNYQILQSPCSLVFLKLY